MRRILTAVAVALVSLSAVLTLAPASQATAFGIGPYGATQYGYAAKHRLGWGYETNGDLTIFPSNSGIRRVRYVCTVLARPTMEAGFYPNGMPTTLERYHKLTLRATLSNRRLFRVYHLRKAKMSTFMCAARVLARNRHAQPYWKWLEVPAARKVRKPPQLADGGSETYLVVNPDRRTTALASSGLLATLCRVERRYLVGVLIAPV